MKQRVITKDWSIWHGMQYATILFFILIVLSIVDFSGTFAFLAKVCAVAFVLVIGYMLYRSVRNMLWLQRRGSALAALAAARGLDFDPLGVGPHAADARMGVIDELQGARDPMTRNVVVSGNDWVYADFSYSLYAKTKYGEYRKATVYYGVISTQLPRRLPNVFFGSIKARRRQFRFHFAASQRHELEGDFNAYFVTYFPEEYTVDSMSFISPDVMWALKDAADYDIEISGDRLFLYGPLYAPAAQLPDMETKLLRIRKELMDNIMTYRDERLPFAEGRQHVAAQAVSLKLSTFWRTVGWVLALGFAAFIIAMSLRG